MSTEQEAESKEEQGRKTVRVVAAVMTRGNEEWKVGSNGDEDRAGRRERQGVGSKEWKGGSNWEEYISGSREQRGADSKEWRVGSNSDEVRSGSRVCGRGRGC